MSTGAPREIGTPIKYPSTALLCVDTQDTELFNTQGYRIDSTTPGDIYINKQRPLMFGYMTRLALTEMNIEWGFPNVYDGNNTLTLGIWDGSEVFKGYTRITIPSEFYNAQELGAQVQAALNADTNVTNWLGINPFVVSIGKYPCASTTEDAKKGKTFTVSDARFTIEIPNTFTAGGYFAIIPYNKPRDGTYTLSSLSDDLTNMMGLTPIQLSGTQYYDKVIGGFASCMRTPYIDVTSNLLTKNQNVADGTSHKRGNESLLARIYLSNEQITNRIITITYDSEGTVADSSDNALLIRSSTFRREFKMPKQIQWNSTENVDVIDLQVLDYKGNVLRYQPTAVYNTVSDNKILEQNNTNDFQFTLQITEV